jgi:hypothetical protein
MLKQLLVTMPWGEHRLLSGFLDSTRGNRLRIVSVQVVPPHVAQTKTWRNFANTSVKTDEVPFRRSLAVWDFCIEHVSDFYWRT